MAMEHFAPAGGCHVPPRGGVWGNVVPQGERARLVRGGVFLGVAGALAEAVAASGDGDDFGVVEEPVEDGAGGGDVAQELAPFVDGAVGGHHGGAVFVAAHDDLQQDFPTLGWKDFQAHVVDDEQVGLEVFV